MVRMSVSREVDFLKVRTFLESIARNSLKTKYAYEMGLKHLQRFLIGSTYQAYNVETILQPLQTGTINAYELIDSFVSYLVSLRQRFILVCCLLYSTSRRCCYPSHKSKYGTKNEMHNQCAVQDRIRHLD
jgi:hypothetical protein